MELITVIDDMPVFNPEVRMVKQFKRLLDRDKGSKGDASGRKKAIATKEFAFIHFWCVYDSRFDSFQGDEKVEIIKEHIDLPEKWKMDDDISEAIKEYKFLKNTPSMRLYKKMVEGVRKIEDFIDELDLDERTNSGNLVFSPDKLRGMIEKMPDTISSLNKAEILIRKEMEDKQDKKNHELSSGDLEGTTIKLDEGF